MVYCDGGKLLNGFDFLKSVIPDYGNYYFVLNREVEEKEFSATISAVFRWIGEKNYQVNLVAKRIVRISQISL